MHTALNSRNAAALRAGQFAWDNAEPPADDLERENYLNEQVETLMSAGDAEHVRFLDDFALDASERLCSLDDHEYPILQLVLAAIRGDFELARKIGKRFEDVLRDAAYRAVMSKECARREYERLMEIL